MRTFFLSCFLIQVAFAQVLNTTEPIKADIKLLQEKYQRKYDETKQLLEQQLKRQNLPLRYNNNGLLVEAYGIDANGHVLYYTTENTVSGKTISTNKVWPGGTTGTSLTGANMSGRLGEWDGGGVRTTHTELNSRVTQVDAPSSLSDHATHVAGTMIAAGVDANAKGMAYAASLQAYDWSNDETEMISAAANGMLVSNHSYGTISGWYNNTTLSRWEWYGDVSISAVEDYKYGFYDQQCSEWDDIAYTNPYYLICKAAGNDRGDQLPNGTTTHYVRDINGSWIASSAARNTVGPYNSIQTNGNCKNVLTVGAVNKLTNGYTTPSAVTMSSFSGWGPTDDGRIKPDVVAAGVGIYSSISTGNTNYATYDGTSMATPAVTGSLLLVQQHYRNLKNTYMKASTLKGLAIHTADEAGTSTGPDYQFGWGLLNTASAVKTITDSMTNRIIERTLNNGTTFTQNITSDGTIPLRITLSWSDVAAAGLNPSLNPTSLLLVNDLDIRLKRLSDNTTFSPYILNPSSPASAATTGDNFRDNVEQIFIAAPQAGIYTITVSHKGTLFSSTPQAFSLIISGVAGPPSAAFSASTISACTAQQVTFTDNSSGSPTSRVWYFPGGNPATSTALNPVVTYAVAGKYAVALKASNGLGSDSIYSTNYITIGGLSLPFTENFESTSATLSSWQIDNPNNDTTWKLTTTQGTTPGNTSYVIPYYNDSARGKRDGLISPVLSLKGYQSTSLTFKYAYTRYSTTSKDSLIVYISNNCGNTWTRLLARGESGTGTFATAPNSTYLSTSYFTPTGSSNWCGGGTGASCPTISLNAYAGQSNIRIKFEGYNDYGNNIYIDNISITGTPLKPVAGFRALKTIVCLGDSVMLSDTSANFPSAWTWTFSGGLPATSTLKNPSVYYNNPGTYPVKLRVSNVSGADSVTINGYITVVAPPSVPTISANKALVICVGDSVLLTCDSNASAYSWYTGSSILPIAGATGKTLYAKADGAYTVEVSNANGCKTKSVPTSLTVNPLPPQPIISSSITGTAFCTGGTAQLTSNAANGNQWYKNNVVVSGANTNTFQTTDSGSYTVQVTANGCKSLMSAPKVLGLYPKPSTSNISGPLTSNYNRTENYSVTGISGSTYTWSIVNGSQTGGTNTNSVSIKWAVADTGYITVRETATTGCKGDFRALAIPLSIGVGLPSIDLITQLTVFPNPANDAIHLAFDNISSKPVTLQLQNMLGQVLYEQMIAHQGKYESRIDLSNIPAGVYMLSINTEDGYKKQTKISVRR